MWLSALKNGFYQVCLDNQIMIIIIIKYDHKTLGTDIQIHVSIRCKFSHM